MSRIGLQREPVLLYRYTTLSCPRLCRPQRVLHSILCNRILFSILKQRTPDRQASTLERLTTIQLDDDDDIIMTNMSTGRRSYNPTYGDSVP